MIALLVILAFIAGMAAMWFLIKKKQVAQPK